MIPRQLFQTWKSKTEIPSGFAHWSKTMREHNPSYEYVLWDDADNRAFLEQHYSWFLPTYDAFPAEIYRADAVRYFYLYHHGGLYADMDVECLRSLDPIMEQSGVVLGRMGTDPDFEHSIPNAIMASEPHQEFWLLPIALMMEAPLNQRPEYVTGPVILKRAHDLYMTPNSTCVKMIHRIKSLMPTQPSGRSEVSVLQSHMWYPLDWTDQIHDQFRRHLMRNNEILSPASSQRMFPKSFLVTYWSHSWEPQAL